MLSVIVENRPHQRLSIKHIGIVNKGTDDTESDAARAWATANEVCSLPEFHVGTEPTVNIDPTPGCEGYSAKDHSSSANPYHPPITPLTRSHITGH